MYKAELTNMDSENLARKKEGTQLKKIIEKYEIDLQEKDKQNEIADQKLVAAEKEIIEIGRELRLSEGRSREYLYARFDAEEKMKVY